MTSEKTKMSQGIGYRLMIARKNMGLRQAHVAEQMNMCRTTVVAIEKGVRRISDEELRQFAALYRVTTDWLLPSDDKTSAPDAPVLLVSPQIRRAIYKITKAREDLEAAKRDELVGYRALYDAVVAVLCGIELPPDED